jgi:GNAT superfamily N-acetyltransferase
MNDVAEAGLAVRLLPAVDLPELLEAHPELGERMLRPSYFCTADWLRAVLHTIDESQCVIAVAMRAATPIAVLPLQRVRTRLGVTELRYLGYAYFPDPLGLVCDWREAPEAIIAIRRFLLALPGWHALVLDFLVPEEAALWGGEARAQSTAPFLLLPPRYDELLQSFAKKKRYKIRAAAAAAADAGMTFGVAQSIDEKRLWLDALFTLHDSRTEVIGRKSTLAGDSVRTLHQALVTQSAAPHLFALNMADRPIAVIYGFLHEDRFAYYQVAHDPAWSELGPGAVLLSHVIEWCCNNGVREFDLLQGRSEYKLRWASGRRDLVRVAIAADRPGAKLIAFIERTLRSVQTILRRR